MTYVGGVAAYYQEDFPRAAAKLRAAMALANEADTGAAASFPGLLLLAGAAGLFLGDERSAHTFHRRALARARHDGALALIAQTAPRLALSDIWAGRWAAAAAGLREGLDTARAWLTAFEPWADSCGVDWARAVRLHCRALLATDESEADRLFLTALDAHTRAARPFERARTELAYGEFLRRARRRIDAREHLRTALDGFETLEAAPWAERARVELRASGQSARRRNPNTLDQLTAQEVQIAGFVAEGLTNREIAAQLFLSPRTIDFHLRNIFRKLGIASRIELARLDLESAGEIAAPAR